MDATETFRRNLTEIINSQIESNNETEERNRLSKEFDQIWNTNELTKDFSVEEFMAPYVIATNLSTGKIGTLLFQHHPRLYFAWREHEE